MAEIENKHMKVKGMPPLVVDDAVMIAHEIHKVHEAIGDLSINAEITTETGGIAQDTTMQAINLTLETLVSGLAVLTQAVEKLDNESEIEQIRTEIATIAGEIEDLTQLSHTLGKDVSEIRSDIDETDETVSDLSEQLLTLDALLKNLQEWAATAGEKMDAMEESVEEAKKEVAAAVEEVNATVGAVTEAVEVATAAAEKADTMAEGIEEAKKDAAEAVEVATAAAEKADELEESKSNVLLHGSLVTNNVAVPNGSSTSFTLDVSRSGYSPLAYVGANITNADSGGTGASNCIVNRIANMTATSWTVYVRNVYSTDALVNISIHVLYIKD